MGFFNRIFGGREELPELDAANPVARRIEPLKPALENLARRVRDPLEVVPCTHGAFVFIGKPTKRFGAAWVQGEEVKNLRQFAEERNIPADRLGALVDDLRRLYEQEATRVPRYATTVAGRTVVVDASEELGRKVEEVLEQVASH
ncbi:MAG: hypothetical protein GXP50_13630 [Deltaproteobacteria bacterium]|nr:hypothetical protein [Deltaproteobacteria bacterium]